MFILLASPALTGSCLTSGKARPRAAQKDGTSRIDRIDGGFQLRKASIIGGNSSHATGRVGCFHGSSRFVWRIIIQSNMYLYLYKHRRGTNVGRRWHPFWIHHWRLAPNYSTRVFDICVACTLKSGTFEYSLLRSPMTNASWADISRSLLALWDNVGWDNVRAKGWCPRNGGNGGNGGKRWHVKGSRSRSAIR